ncbi:MAG: DUF4430 domain-containing protein, partial [Clostridia bacterium]|nr:DUF4430 domain-containing protein [Clostridia bacterium]
AEKDCGGMSGWVYYINGVSGEISCDKVTLQEGDTIRWSYTIDGIDNITQ